MLRLDPFALPVQFAARDAVADDEVRHVELHRERVVVRRAVRGVPMALNMPLSEFRGVALRIMPYAQAHEAFAAVVLRFMQHFKIDKDKINVNGGAIAMGHPLGATGAMILGTVLDELERTDKETALVTLCIGAGMGTATIIERV